MNGAELGWRPWWRDPSWIAAIGAVMLGVSALSVSIYQSKLMHEQQRMGVWPYLTALNYDLSDDHYAFKLHNEGVGPAKIRFVEVSLDGVPQTGWPTLLEKLGLPKTRQSYSTMANRVLPAGVQIEALQLYGAEPIQLFRSNLARLGLKLCYCSIYEDCYLYENASSETTTAVEACPATETQVFRQ